MKNKDKHNPGRTIILEPGLKYDRVKPRISITVSSCKNKEIDPDCILIDDSNEWVTNEDHKNAWIRMKFDEQKIARIMIADRVDTGNSMIVATVRFFDKAKEVHNMTININGDSSITTHLLDKPITCNSLLLEATDKVWGYDQGLRYLNIG